MKKKRWVRNNLRPKKKIVVATAGGFDPRHIGATSGVNQRGTKNWATGLIVILNNRPLGKKKEGPMSSCLNKSERKSCSQLREVDEVCHNQA